MISAFMAQGSGFRKSGAEQPLFLDYSVRAQARLFVAGLPVRFLIHFVVAIKAICGGLCFRTLSTKENRQDGSRSFCAGLRVLTEGCAFPGLKIQTWGTQHLRES
jgi:hypothetical protein